MSKHLFRLPYRLITVRKIVADSTLSVYYQPDEERHGAIGLLFNPCALWVGAHYSKHQRRWCINLVPMLTVWLTLRGGTEP